MKKERITIKKIKEVCSKPGMEDCYFRKSSYPLTWLILHTKLTPTDITWLWVLFGLASLPFFFIGSYWFTIIGTILLVFGFLLDHIDGSLARFKKQYSDKGYYLDEVGSFIVISLWLVGLGYGAFRNTGNIVWLWLGIGSMFSYLMFQLMHFFTEVKKFKGKKTSSASQKHPEVHKKYTFISKILPGHLDQIFYMLMILVIFGLGHWVLVYFILVYTGMWAGRAGYDYLYSFKN